MYVYRKTDLSPDRPYEVGYWHANLFRVASRHEDAIKARRRVNYLNGGAVPRSGQGLDSLG